MSGFGRLSKGALSSFDASWIGREDALEVAPGVLGELTIHAARLAPREACGALLGRSSSEGAHVAAATLARNVASDPRTAFDVHPADLVQAEDRAKVLGLQLLGVWHSHPDGSAFLSAADRRGVFASWLQLVVAAGETRAWVCGAPGAGEGRSWGRPSADGFRCESTWRELRIVPPPSAEGRGERARGFC